MKNKATHYGTCQLCGSLQKLPNGVLANHGYQVTWHEFVGICHGSHHAPFELSKELAEEELRRCEQLLATHPELPAPLHADFYSRRNEPEVVAYRNRLKERHAWKGAVGWLRPRCKGWRVKPLREVAEEDGQAERLKVASRNVRQLASFRNDAKWALGKAIDKLNDIVGYDAFGSLNSATCVKIAGMIAASGGRGYNGYRETRFDLDEAMAEVSHTLTAHAVWLEAKAAADEAKAAFENDKAAARRQQQ
jgi:hypothetical protein